LDVAAEKIGVGTAVLAQWEEGTLRPSFAKLRVVAKVYKKPLAFFYFSEPPEDLEIPPDFRTLGRFADISFELMAAIMDACSRQEIMATIYDSAGWSRPSFAYDIGHLRTPGAVAAFIRTILEVSLESQYGAKDPYASLSLWRRAIEGIGVLVFQAGIPVSEMRGLSLYNDTFPIIIINSQDAPNARVFSLMHEFCHLLRRKSGVCTLSEFGAEGEEAFCDAVAAETLLPRQAVEEYVHSVPEDPELWRASDFAKASKTFGVSEHVVVRRLHDLGLISTALYRAKVKDLSMRQFGGGNGGSFYRNKVAQLGRPFINTVLAAFNAGLLSSRDAAVFLGAKIDNFEKLRDAAA